MEEGITITYNDLQFFLLSKIENWKRETKDCTEFEQSL